MSTIDDELRALEAELAEATRANTEAWERVMPRQPALQGQRRVETPSDEDMVAYTVAHERWLDVCRRHRDFVEKHA
jgi:hypothetical protein